MTATDLFARTWRRLIPTRRRVVVYAMVLLALLVVRLGFGLWAGHRLQVVTDRLAAVYGGLSMTSLAPPRVTSDENRARVFAAAAALTVTGDLKVQAALQNAIFKGLPADPGQRVAVLRRAVETNVLALQVLDAAESRPKWNWGIDYSDGVDMRIPALMEIRSLSRLNIAAGLVSLADGKPDEAARHVRIGLALEESLAPEGVLIVGLIRVAVAGEQFRLLREVLGGGDPSAAVLETLAPHLEAEAGRQQTTPALAGELKYVHHSMQEVESGREDMDGSSPMLMNQALAWLIRPIILADQEDSLALLDRMVQYSRLQPFERAERRLRSPTETPRSWWRRRAPGLLAGVERAVQSGDELRTEAVLATAAVALRRHRLARGSYPSALEDLVPAYLAAVPIDPFTGRPPEYKTSGAGFELKAQVRGYRGAPADRFVWSIPR